ncbi:hypothetical protein FKG94_09955 [Exilibacterium tricleocarpae]|uniref:Chromosome partitioning protein ParA n=1 Tax=Exilibacterium tricleocarpae TaxID=2591008 RepID=A0A545TUW4_9GAMM|nr:hypothetical protein [Exilibacterium tricleocarpae]TQV81010.1 hypothetical protein FKG94_09955 [Exilibacterium tricleocarpae]
MAAKPGAQTQAVLFFEHNAIVREMLHAEFEAILDGFVPVTEKAGDTVKAVFLRVNPQLKITAAVFFLIDFDPRGFADKRWNIPLEQFADTAGRGPDLGAGPIRLACRSQCPVAWHQQQLWDPEMQPGANNFVILRKGVQRNRLGLQVVEEAPPEPPPAAAAPPTQIIEPAALERHISQKLQRQLEQEFRDRMAQTLKEQRLRILTLDSKRKQELQELQLEHQRRIQEHQEKIEQIRQLHSDEQQRNQQLKQTIDGQAAKIEGVREYFEHKLKTAKSIEIAQLQTLKTNFEMELDAKIEAATTELKEMLQMREVELTYRNELVGNLNEEISRLRQENQQLLSDSADQLLDKMNRSGISFVAFHPGAGHMTIPLSDMSTYLENPTAYAAQRCGVGEKQYEGWLAHYTAPTCQALNEQGELCGTLVTRVESPADFHSGESDRCYEHQSNVTTLAVV